MVQIVMGVGAAQKRRRLGRTDATLYSVHLLKSIAPYTCVCSLRACAGRTQQTLCSMLPALRDGFALCYPRCRPPFSVVSTFFRTVARRANRPSVNTSQPLDILIIITLILVSLDSCYRRHQPCLIARTWCMNLLVHRRMPAQHSSAGQADPSSKIITPLSLCPGINVLLPLHVVEWQW